MRIHYLMISIICFLLLLIWVVVAWGNTPKEITGPHDEAWCREIAYGDCLHLIKSYSKTRIVVDPTVSKHAAAQYHDGKEWHYYRFLPEFFTPGFYFTPEQYVKWYHKNYAK